MMKITNYKLQIINYIRHPLFSGSTIMVGGSLFINAINYFYHLFMGRILGPSDYGELASLYSILYIVSMIPVSASVAIVKFISSAKGQEERLAVYNGVKGLIFWLSVISSLIIALLSPAIASFLNIGNVFLVVLVSPILFLSLVTLVNQSTSQGLLQFSGVVIPNFVSGLLKLVLGVILVYLGYSVMGAMVGVLVSVLFAYIISVKIISKKLNMGKTERIFDRESFLKYSFPVLLQSLALTSFFTADVILVKHYFGAHEAGLYAALSTLGKIIYFGAQPVTSAMFPIVAGRHAKGEKYNKVLYASIFATFAISFSVLIFYWLFPDISIGLLYGREYLSVSAELVWMGLFMTIYTLSYLLVNFRLSLGDTKIVLLPIFFAIFQIVGILSFHQSILQVIQISLFSTILLAFSLGFFISYNSIWRRIYSR